MQNCTIALFGEAEKGDFRTAYLCHTASQLLDYVGHPPIHSRGIYYAIQALLYERLLIFFRVREEGFSYQDYFIGLRLLETEQRFKNISAFCLPGVGDAGIIEALTPICTLFHSIIITNEADFYDYLMAS